MMPVIANIILENFRPPWLWLGIIVISLVVLTLTYRGIYRQSGRRLTCLLAVLRIFAVMLVIFALVKPAWQHVSHSEQRPVVAVIVDTSQSMSLPHPQSDSTQWSSRYTQARHWLEDSSAGKSLRQRFDVMLYDIQGRLLEGRLPDEPIAERTDLLGTLDTAARRLRGRRAAGVVLISDGRDTTPRSDYQSLSQFPLPVIALGYRQPSVSSSLPLDIAVVSVQAPARVLVGNQVPVRVLVRKDAGAPVTLPVSIQRAGQVLASLPVSLEAGIDEKLVTVSFTPEQPGEFVLTAQAAAQPNERDPDNNARTFKLRVAADPIRVLYLEGVLRPEFKFLRQSLAQDPDVDLITFVRAGSGEDASVAAVADELTSEARLEKVDVVLLGDFEANMLDHDAYQRLARWTEAGGGLMVLGGYHNLTPRGLYDTPLGGLLPLEPSHGIEQIDEPFEMSLTAAGMAHPALTLTGDQVRDARMWHDLPALSGVAATGPARPAASVLARHPRINPDLSDQRGYAVLATQPFGKGLVAEITADTTWRWSRLAKLRGESDTLYVRFWSQMIRWLAKRDVQSQQSALTLTTDKPAYRRGERVAIDLWRNPAAALPGDDGAGQSMRLTMLSPDGRDMQLPIEADPLDPDRWTAQVFPDRGGRFVLQAQWFTPGKDDTPILAANELSEFLVEAAKQELSDPATNETLMRQFARLTGGGYAEINDPAAATDLLDQLPAEPIERQTIQTSRLWNSPAVFVLFVVLISIEWTLRRRNQLV